VRRNGPGLLRSPPVDAVPFAGVAAGWPPQRRRALDDPGEADLLAHHGQRDDAGQQADARRTRQRSRGRRAEHRAKGVGAGVAEHGPLAQILWQQRERRPERRGHGDESRRASAGTCLRSPGHGAADGDEAAGKHGDLDGSTRAEVEQVEQVRAARDEARVDHHVGRAIGGRVTKGRVTKGCVAKNRGGEARGGQATELDRAGGHLTVGQGAQVAAEAATLSRARQIVDEAERQGTRAGQSQAAGGAGTTGPFLGTLSLTVRGAIRRLRGDRGADQLRGDRADGSGGAFDEGDELAPVVGARPGLLTGRGATAQPGVGGSRGDGGHRADGYRAGRTPHFFFTDVVPFPFAVLCGVGVMVGAALNSGNGTGLTADAPEIP
jgi:hypothetical protein